MRNIFISFIIQAVEFAAELQASLQEFVASDAVEVRDNGGRGAPFPGMPREVLWSVWLPRLCDFTPRRTSSSNLFLRSLRLFASAWRRVIMRQ